MYEALDHEHRRGIGNIRLTRSTLNKTYALRCRTCTQRNIQKLLSLLFLFPLSCQFVYAQTDSASTGFLINPTGQLSFQLLPGITKYLGEFTDNTVGLIANMSSMYRITPVVSAGLYVGTGKLTYRRRARAAFSSSYEYQYNSLNSAYRETKITTAQIQIGIHLFPQQRFCPYLLLGAGATIYLPQDFEKWVGRNYPDRPFKQRYATLSIPTGIGVDYFLYPNLAITLEVFNNYTFVDDLDAFDSPFIRSKRLVDQNIKEINTSIFDATDNYVVVGLGLKYFIFGNNDADGDKLSNEEEKKRGTNPNEVDTDGDGLTDYEEIKIYDTNPLKVDSDEDGLSDYLEVRTYKTNPLEEDTDGDGLTDQEEVIRYKTNPLKRDTDGDGIADNEELRRRTDPNYFDTDRDGISDYDELYVFHTNPLMKDSDGDGLTDKEELALRTDPIKMDTDGDGLTDYEEIKNYHTNPQIQDTDGDSLSDYVEVKQVGSSPLTRDTDGDGVPDNLDQCPTTIGLPEKDGCMEVKERPGLVTRQVRQIGDTLSLQEAQSIVINGILFEEDSGNLKPESMPKLNELKNIFTLNSTLIAEIHGYTDSYGSASMNKSLSFLRANTIRDYLVKQGIDPARIIAKGFGEENPIASNKTRQGRMMNRRIELLVVSIGSK